MRNLFLLFKAKTYKFGKLENVQLIKYQYKDSVYVQLNQNKIKMENVYAKINIKVRYFIIANAKKDYKI